MSGGKRWPPSRPRHQQVDSQFPIVDAPVMSADFWAGYASGAIGIIVGNPLDVLKVRSQAGSGPTLAPAAWYSRPWSGTAAPVLGYGALNALLFVTYHRADAWLNSLLHVPAGTGNLSTTWLAGAIGGLATFPISTPTELVKCHAQLSSPPVSTWTITRRLLRTEGLRGLYVGGSVTALRDTVGYGFYFWSYELSRRWFPSPPGHDTPRALLCGGLAGVATWASIFPLDMVKTRVQTQTLIHTVASEGTPLLTDRPGRPTVQRLGAWLVATQAYAEAGPGVFWRGLSACMVRAAVVNAFQWATYEYMMQELGHGRVSPKRAEEASSPVDSI